MKYAIIERLCIIYESDFYKQQTEQVCSKWLYASKKLDNVLDAWKNEYNGKDVDEYIRYIVPELENAENGYNITLSTEKTGPISTVTTDGNTHKLCFYKIYEIVITDEFD